MLPGLDLTRRVSVIFRPLVLAGEGTLARLLGAVHGFDVDGTETVGPNARLRGRFEARAVLLVITAQHAFDSAREYLPAGPTPQQDLERRQTGGEHADAGLDHGPVDIECDVDCYTVVRRKVKYYFSHAWEGHRTDMIVLRVASLLDEFDRDDQARQGACYSPCICFSLSR